MRKILRSLATLLTMSLACAACDTVPSRPGEGRFVKRALMLDGVPHRYQVFVPSQAAGGRRPPVILFLHGSGERGSDGDRPVAVGLGPYVHARIDTFPAIVVFPQAPENSEWSGASATLALQALDAATGEFDGDARRTYLSGLSMGGYGVWELALLQPQRFAALVPICGALRPPNDERELFVTPVTGEADPYAALARQLHALPIWIFHGAKDDLVPPTDDRLTAAALKAAGGDLRYTEYPDANHNAWDPAYATPELWTWLFAQHR
ncbi:MAG: prolyl oligopeptidase family serine peptidase [Luteimonas sp.]